MTDVLIPGPAPEEYIAAAPVDVSFDVPSIGSTGGDTLGPIAMPQEPQVNALLNTRLAPHRTWSDGTYRYPYLSQFEPLSTIPGMQVDQFGNLRQSTPEEVVADEAARATANALRETRRKEYLDAGDTQELPIVADAPEDIDPIQTDPTIDNEPTADQEPVKRPNYLPAAVALSGIRTAFTRVGRAGRMEMRAERLRSKAMYHDNLLGEQRTTPAELALGVDVATRGRLHVPDVLEPFGRAAVLRNRANRLEERADAVRTLPFRERLADTRVRAIEDKSSKLAKAADVYQGEGADKKAAKLHDRAERKLDRAVELEAKNAARRVKNENRPKRHVRVATAVGRRLGLVGKK